MLDYNLPKVSGFCLKLKASTGPNWNRATRHPFTDLIGSGTATEAQFRRYLVNDYYFVGYFVQALENLIKKAPNKKARNTLRNFLVSVTDTENDYFERSLETLGLSFVDAAKIEPDESIVALSAFLLDVSEIGTYEHSLTAFLACEWIYEEWALIQATKPKPEQFYLAEWITLHSSREFLKFVAWIREEINSRSQYLGPQDCIQMELTFNKVVRMEVDFWNASLTSE